MDEFIKALWVVFFSAVMAMISYFEPVINMIIAITIIFVVDIIFGIASGKKLNKEPVSFKKGFAAIKLFGIYIFVITLLYAIGKLMYNEKMILYVVKTISWVAIYFYVTNLTKNLRRLNPNVKCIKFIHWFLSVEFLDNIPSLKKFLEKYRK
jgi:hypothetical protein